MVIILSYNLEKTILGQKGLKFIGKSNPKSVIIISSILNINANNYEL